MPYSATTFYDGAPPALTAGELNRVGAGTARALDTAAAASASAVTAGTSAAAALAVTAGRTRLLRTQDGPTVTGTAVVADPVLQVTLTGVAGRMFLVTFVLVYRADASLGGAVSLVATNGSTLAAGGADVYWVSVGTSSTDPGESTVLGYHTEGVTASVRTGLVGDLGPLPGSPHALTGHAHVRNGTSVGALSVRVMTGEATTAGVRAAPGSGMRLLAGSTMTVEQLS